MSIEQGQKPWRVEEQIFDDPITGLTFQVMPDGKPRLRVFGKLLFGNREFFFNSDGIKSWSGTAIRGLCRPAWTTKVDD